ncbi:MAG: 2-oxoglutarate dehydrogenase E1 component [Ectothiorhodospiraceae bacterium]|jgi:2-oxoglutarate dehydrogenase E1 component|nr:2-oxoglutarate dehydrogenase E1 component [Ectothiorhodospiraceae bacterium]
MDIPTRNRDMNALWGGSPLDAGNAEFLDTLYEQWLRDPQSVPTHWREWFATLPRPADARSAEEPHAEVREQFRRLGDTRRGGAPFAQQPAMDNLEHERKQVRVLQLINAYRFLGHLKASLDPLALNVAEPPPELTLAHHRLTEGDLDTVFNTGSLAGPKEAPLGEIIAILEDTYCATIGAEYMHIPETQEKRWLQARLEGERGRGQFDREQKRYILDRLTAAEGLEQYLHTKYVGQKRFSLEGGEGLIPMLDELVRRAGAQGTREIVLGMAHRGRLNVLVNILGKPPSMLFEEFEGRRRRGNGTGDVKYHMGFSSDMNTPGGPVHLALAFNPSHLEIVGPVVEGSVRARQERRGDREGRQVLPVLIHGDAAFAGQGVIMETLNMSQTRGFSTKGTVHIVINNQIGFTTSTQRDARSTYYCTDVAKMVNAPILHVNGDDPEAVVFVTQIALDYRMTFNKDVVIDLVCYRRHGHNEADEPAATQPVMYQRIKALPTTRALYAERLVQEGTLDAERAEQIRTRCRARLEEGQPMVPYLLDSSRVHNTHAVDWSRYVDVEWDRTADTSLSLERIRELWSRLERLPPGFELQSRVAKIMDDRRKMAAGALALDWGFGETLAYASLVEDGYPVRLSGQDAGRGTFFHRHAVLFNQQDGSTHVPLRKLSEEQACFLVIDSLLSEEGVLAFEYGYATAEPDGLVIWEAQFGDFANGAQVVIDQFISSGEQKWGRLCGLTMLLPHGYEGQGPEHSSARPERYLQLCAQHNMQVCTPTTPAQIFHLLRRQVLRPYRKPLIVMSPKSLLRHKLAVSSLEDLTRGRFQNVIPEIDPIDPSGVRRVVLCGGKVYYDLLEKRRADERNDVAILRIEQLYPFPEQELAAALAPYAKATSWVWCQEEPLNQGAWYATQHHIRTVLGEKRYLEHVTRPASASPAVGYHDLHVQQQQELVATALGEVKPATRKRKAGS